MHPQRKWHILPTYNTLIWSMHKNDKSFLETYKKTKVKTKQNKQRTKNRR